MIEIDYSLVLNIVRETRAYTLPKWGAVDFTVKSTLPSDVVTEIDKTTERFLAEKLSGEYPRIPFVGEEHGGDRNYETFWLCDPIDGTAHYIRGLPFCTTMICLIDHGAVVFSAIYHFVTDDMYYAIRDKGAYKNDQSISVNTQPLQGAYIGLGSDESLVGMTQIRRRIEEHGCAIVKTKSTGWEFSMVAEGKLEARVQINPTGDIYDYAPGSLLVTEAGGLVRNIGSDTYDYRDCNFIASNKNVHMDIQSLLDTATI